MVQCFFSLNNSTSAGLLAVEIISRTARFSIHVFMSQSSLCKFLMNSVPSCCIDLFHLFNAKGTCPETMLMLALILFLCNQQSHKIIGVLVLQCRVDNSFKYLGVSTCLHGNVIKLCFCDRNVTILHL